MSPFYPGDGIHCSACFCAEFLLFQNTGHTEKGNIMATTKETMKVIAIGIDNSEDDYEPSDVEELASEIVFEIVEKTAADFVLLAEGSDPECVEMILKLLSKKHNTSFAYTLRTIFLAAGWGDAVWRLNLLHACDAYDEATFDFFYDYFFNSEALTDYRIKHFPDDEDEKDNSPDIKLN